MIWFSLFILISLAFIFTIIVRASFFFLVLYNFLDFSFALYRFWLNLSLLITISDYLFFNLLFWFMRCPHKILLNLNSLLIFKGTAFWVRSIGIILRVTDFRVTDITLNRNSLFLFLLFQESVYLFIKIFVLLICVIFLIYSSIWT